MRKYFLFLGLLNFCLSNAQTLTVEKIMQDKKWIGSSPSNVVWSADSKSLYFGWNPNNAKGDSVYSFTINTTAPVKLNYKDGQIAYAMSSGNFNSTKTKVTYAYKGDIYLLDVATKNNFQITETTTTETNPLFIKNDTWIAYISDNNFFEWNMQDGSTIQLSNFINDNAPVESTLTDEEKFVQEKQLETSDILKQRKEKSDAEKIVTDAYNSNELKKIYTEKKQLQGLTISPDARYISYTLFTPAENAKNTIVPDYVTESGYTTDIPSRSKVGEPQGHYEFYIYDKIKDTVLKINSDSITGITEQPDFVKDYPSKFAGKKPVKREVYMNVYWNREGTHAIADVFSVDFKDRWLMQLDASTGKLNLIDRQHDDAWIAGPGISWIDFTTLGWINENTFYFQSEATGYSHLYSYDFSTHAKTAITQGNYEIQRVYISNNKKYFYILTNEEHPGKQSLFRINIDGTNKQKITSLTGGYEISISPDEKYIAYRYSYQNKPWELYVQENTAGKTPLQVTNKAMTDEFKNYPWRDTKIFTFKARDGADVYARIYEPSPGKKNNAAVIFVHGAGYLQNVQYQWSYYYHEFMFNNLLADKGYTILDIDYRGSAGYGRDWRVGIYRYMGGKDLDDEVDAAHFLTKEYGIDPNRIGMYGGSYGGFMTLMALFTQPDVFKAGAALRPVTDWAHYSDGYSDAILNKPYEDSIAYQRSSPINFASGLKNHLLICHGMLDVNVHFQDAVRLAQRLIELGKNNWELAVFPVEDHGFVEPSSWTDEYKRILKLFDDNLLK